MLMKHGMSLFRFLITPFFLIVIFTTSESFAKKAAIVIDFDTKEVLFEVNANTKNYPASLTKIMTLYILFDKLEKKQINLLISHGVDGILISLANETANYDHLNAVLAQDKTLVMFDKIAKIVKCSKIIIDDRNAAYKATQHLIDSGCKRIAH